MQVLTTVDSTEEAERLARSITGARLAACVQIGDRDPSPLLFASGNKYATEF